MSVLNGNNGIHPVKFHGNHHQDGHHGRHGFEKRIAGKKESQQVQLTKPSGQGEDLNVDSFATDYSGTDVVVDKGVLVDQGFKPGSSEHTEYMHDLAGVKHALEGANKQGASPASLSSGLEALKKFLKKYEDKEEQRTMQVEDMQSVIAVLKIQEAALKAKMAESKTDKLPESLSRPQSQNSWDDRARLQIEAEEARKMAGSRLSGAIQTLSTVELEKARLADLATSNPFGGDQGFSASPIGVL